MKTKTFDDLYREAESRDDYWTAGVIQDFTEEVSRLMEEQKVTRTELARRMEATPAYVTKVLRGNVNFTVASMVKLARALGAELRVELTLREAGARNQPLRRPRGVSGGHAAHTGERWAARSGS